MILLFVDDEDNVLLSLKRSLYMWAKKNNLETHFSSDSKSAVEFIKENHEEIAVVITDQKMPDLKGSTLVNIIKEKYPEIVAIILSGHSDLTDINDFLKANIFSFIEKPWSSETLKRELLKAVEYYKIKKENKLLKEGIKTELLLAKEFQKKLFNIDKIDRTPLNYNITYKASPATGISGDYYDIIKLDSNHYFIILGDISGHGIKPAFISVALKSIINYEYFNNRDVWDPRPFIEWLNFRLCQMLKGFNDIFLSITAILIDREKKLLKITNCGQPSVLLKRGDSLEKLDNNNIVLGVSNENNFSQLEINLLESDEVLLMSDGLHPLGNDFNLEESDFLEIFKSIDFMDHKEIIKRVENFNNNKPIEDDITIINVKV